MIERSEGIILRTRPLTETSLIVNWLTPELGRITTVAKGARRPKSPFRGKLDLFYSAEFSFRRSRRSELHTLAEVSLKSTHTALRQDLTSLEQACYCAELIEQTTETETPIPVLHGLLLEFLGELEQGHARALTVLAFEWKVLDELGLGPDFHHTRVSATAAGLARALTEPSLEDLRKLKPGPEAVAELARFLNQFMLHHLGRVPKERPAALNLPSLVTSLPTPPGPGVPPTSRVL